MFKDTSTHQLVVVVEPFIEQLSLAGHRQIEDIDRFAPASHELPERAADVQLVDHYIDGKGVHRIKGNALLKKSQAYPPLFLGGYIQDLLTITSKQNALNQSHVRCDDGS